MSPIPATPTTKDENISGTTIISSMLRNSVPTGWVVSRKKDAARLEIEPYHKLTKKQVREVEQEGEAFLRFMEEDAKDYIVEVQAFAG